MIKLNVTKRNPEDNLETLRAEGKIPGVYYGPHVDNTLISFDRNEFQKVYREAGTSSVINLSGDVDEQCFVQDMQVHVVSGDILHVDFKIVSAGETTEVSVPVETEGEAPAVANKLGILQVSHHELTLEAVPSKIPSVITIDVSNLNEVGDHIKVSDLKVAQGVTILDDAEMILVSISGLQEEEEEEVDEDGPTMEEVLADPSAETSSEGEEEKEG